MARLSRVEAGLVLTKETALAASEQAEKSRALSEALRVDVVTLRASLPLLPSERTSSELPPDTRR
jgi:hypothetical protein